MCSVIKISSLWPGFKLFGLEILNCFDDILKQTFNRDVNNKQTLTYQNLGNLHSSEIRVNTELLTTISLSTITKMFLILRK